MIYVGFRYDDYGLLATPFSVEEAIVELLTSFEIHQSYGVVPGWLQKKQKIKEISGSFEIR